MTKKEEITIRSSTAEYLTYIASVREIKPSVEMRHTDENSWLSQKLMAALHDMDVRTVKYHIKKIFADSKLQEDSVIPKIRITADDGKTDNANRYSLEMMTCTVIETLNAERGLTFTYFFDDAGTWTCLAEGNIFRAECLQSARSVFLNGNSRSRWYYYRKNTTALRLCFIPPDAIPSAT